MVKVWIAGLLAAGASSLAPAQGVLSVEFTGQATVLAGAKGTTSCGLRFVGVYGVPTDANTMVDTVDASVAFHQGGLTLVKAGHTTGRLAAGVEGQKFSGKQPSWIRVDGEKPILPLEGKVIPGEAAGYFLFGITSSEAVSFLRQVIDGKKAWVAFNAGKPSGLVFSGPIKLDAQVLDQFQSCIDDLKR
jgi:hypothetical protein